jgi:uncharacterized protein
MRIFFAFLGFLLLAACSQDGAGPRLPAGEVTIDTVSGPVTFHVEIAADDASRKQGLMKRTELAHDAGMLFDFHAPQQVGFWMKDTPLSLDMVFIRADGTISNIVTHTMPYSTNSELSLEPIRAVLEINAGQSDAHGIKPGDRVRGAIFGNGAGRAAG